MSARNEKPDWTRAHHECKHLDGRRVLRAYRREDRRVGMRNVRDPLESRIVLTMLAFAAFAVLLAAAMGWLS